MEKIIEYEMPTDRRFRDKTGEVRNSWIVVEFSHRIITKQDNGKTQIQNFWTCSCLDCGKSVKVIPWNNLISGASKSCGCSVRRTERQVMEVGDRVGCLELVEVLDKTDFTKYKRRYGIFKCEICSSESMRPLSEVARRKYKTCGSKECNHTVNQC